MFQNKKLILKISLFVAFFLLITFTIFYNSVRIKEKIYVYLQNDLIKKINDNHLLKNKSQILKSQNDYNVVFLPDTQFVNLSFNKIKLNFISSDKNVSYKDLKKHAYKSFFLSQNKNNIFAFDVSGNSFLLNIDFKKLESTTKFIKNNLVVDKILDIFSFDDMVYVSYIYSENNLCKKFYLGEAKYNNDKLIFKNIFVSPKCGKFIQGGRIQHLNYKKNNQTSSGLIFSLSDNIADSPNNDAQDLNSFYGKILFYNFLSKKVDIFSSGHRNPQGLLVYKDYILSTEHGPKGGDEINRIYREKNYGWPIVSYGKKYYSDDFYNQNHSSNGFEEPLYVFIPSIGISEIINIPNNFSSLWSDNFLVSSLGDMSLYRVKFNKNLTKVLFTEKIYVGDRIRDLIYVNKDKAILLALEKNGEIGIIKVKN